MSKSDIFTKSVFSNTSGAYKAYYSEGSEKEHKGQVIDKDIDQGYIIVSSSEGSLFKATCLSHRDETYNTLSKRYGGVDVVASSMKSDDFKILVTAVGKINKDVAKARGINPDIEEIKEATYGIGKALPKRKEKPQRLRPVFVR